MTSVDINEAIKSNSTYICAVDNSETDTDIAVSFSFTIKFLDFSIYEFDFDDNFKVMDKIFDLQQGHFKLLTAEIKSLNFERITPFHIYKYFSVIDRDGYQFNSAHDAGTFTDFNNLRYLEKLNINIVRNNGEIIPKLKYTDKIPFYLPNDDTMEYCFSVSPCTFKL